MGGGGGVDQYSHDSDVEILQQQIPLASTFYYAEVLGLYLGVIFSCSWRSNAKPTLNPVFTKYVTKRKTY
jgi:hypothetical protein